MQRLLLSLFVLFIALVSCSSMKSGQYVYLKTPAQIKSITKNYRVTLDELRSANSERALQGKEWIFVPTKIGIAYLLRDTYVIEDYSSLGKGRFIWPVPQFYKVSSHFGKRGRRNHDGIDIPAPKGTPIVSVDDGVVVYSDNGIRGYGNMIVIAHRDEIFTVYAHNRSNKVDKGDSVKKGEKIAEIGNTGRSTGPHLH
nr:M23 family metallopeptidase [Bdellovibrionales bacterium]